MNGLSCYNRGINNENEDGIEYDKLESGEDINDKIDKDDEGECNDEKYNFNQNEIYEGPKDSNTNSPSRNY